MARFVIAMSELAKEIRPMKRELWNDRNTNPLPPPRGCALAPLDIDHYPNAPATWELPPCMGCGGECVFSDGLCAVCWRAYTESVA